MRLRHASALSVVALALVSCAALDKPERASAAGAITEPTRDWAMHPAVLELPVATDVYVVSDVHGSAQLFRTLLRANGLTDATDTWTAGAAMLVVVGDMIDKGPDSLGVVDLIRSLESQATLAGGRVVTTLGNHEAEFLADPLNSKATSTGVDKEGVDNELEADDITPASVAQCTDTAGRGAWISGLPLALHLGDWFFVHAGNSATLSIAKLETSLENAINTSGYAGVTTADSLLEAESWYGSPTSPTAGSAQAAALGVKHIVFGHNPGAFNESGRVKSSSNGILIKIDTAMGIQNGANVGQPFFLHIHHDMTGDAVNVLDASGSASPLP